MEDFHDAYGIEKSAVSENIIEASREKVKELMERAALGFRQLSDSRPPFRDES